MNHFFIERNLDIGVLNFLYLFKIRAFFVLNKKNGRDGLDMFEGLRVIRIFLLSTEICA